ncbi:hypothetical protein CLV24_1395 [Pontibacter ummariensis]|uniref:EF hand n=2 Tax=Pontibacter ummariensis TaxID=1610492 RepID=A0A239LDD6_9BACT|nr:hypothetical protein CLV24_1395 [Pontibacter ummariensis]SNT28310.1 hypothetical protein SAMN06296052_13927 [Pontibacter ummariensis]
MNNYSKLFRAFIIFLALGLPACGNEGEGAKLFKTYNQDENDYLEEREFYVALEEMNYFTAWNKDDDAYLSEDEWSAAVDEYLGGYQIATVEQFGEWDLDGDNMISQDEFRDNLFEVVDKDDNVQISESEFVELYNEGRSPGGP